MKKICSTLVTFCVVLLAQAQQQIALDNPSFDATPALPGNANVQAWAPAPWFTASAYWNCPGVCSIQPTPDGYPDGLLGMNASHGTEFMGMAASAVTGSGYTGGEAVYQQLICPLEPGITYSFTIDTRLGTDFFSGAPDPDAYLVVAAANAVPANQEFNQPDILDTILVNSVNWTTGTATFTPTQTYNYLILSGGWSTGSGLNNTYLYIDNIQNVTNACGITLEVELDNDTICEGDCSNLTASVLNGTPPFTITWNQGVPNGTGPHQVCPDSTTTYSAIVVDALGESDTAAITLTVIDFPSLQLTASADTICLGESVQLDVTGASIYQWFPVGGTGSFLVDTPAQSTVYQVVGSNWNCSDTISLEVNVRPPLTYQMQGTDPTCNGFNNGSVLISNVSGGAYTATWNGIPGDSLTGLGAGTYVLEVIDPSVGCTYYDSITLQNPAPIVAFITGDTVLCEGDSTVLSVTASGGTAPYQFQWQGAGVSNVDYAIQPQVSAYYAVTVTDAAGCTGEDSTYVTVHLPPVLVTGGPYEGCAPLTVDFENLTQGNVDFVWDFGDGDTSSAVSPVHTYLADGTYDVQLIGTSDVGCTSVLNMGSWVNVHPIPDIDLTVSSTQLNELNDPVLTLYGNVLHADSCVVDFGDGTVIETCDWNNLDHQYIAPGDYLVTIWSYNEYGCWDSVSIAVNYTLTPTIYLPNAFTPNGDLVNDEFLAQGTNIEEFRLQVFDRWGELIFESNDINQGWDGTHKGQQVQQDVYVWKLTYYSNFGDYGENIGHVTLIR